MDENSGQGFLDVPALLESSFPRARQSWIWYGVGIFLLIVMVSTYASMQSAGAARGVEVLSLVVMVLLVAAAGMMTPITVWRQRAELRKLEAVEELVQLRRWPEAAGVLQEMLSQPTRTPQARAQALIFLSGVLARYHRYEDSIAVHNHLLETIHFDAGTEHGIRLGRAMAMLHEDHLFDADRAISELRRSSGDRSSGGLALIEIYREVKTGHPVEAIERFNDKLPAMREQLGHRVGDAYGLVARAYDLLGRESEARAAYEKATTLEPVVELNRRYKEVAAIANKYQPAAAPAEAA